MAAPRPYNWPGIQMLIGVLLGVLVLAIFGVLYLTGVLP